MEFVPHSHSPSDFRLHQRQAEVFACPARFRVLVAGRRFGKTHLALVEMLHAACTPGRTVWYVGPNDEQSKRIAWERLKEMSKPFWAKRPLEEHMRIDLTFGSTVVVKGAFKPDNLRGNGLDFLVIDEYADMPPRAWVDVLRPALTDRKGRALFIGTPKGRNHFFDLYERGKREDPEWAAFQFTTAEGGLVDEDELNSTSRDLDPETFRQEMLAQFINIGLYNVYHSFNRASNVKPVHFDGGLPLVWSVDFNVDPMCMLLIQQTGDVVNVLEEIIIKPNANTTRAAEAFLERAHFYYRHSYKRPLILKIYGDASGNQRSTAGEYTDWTIIKNSFHLWEGTFLPEYYIGSSNPGVRDRINCVNARLHNHADESRLFIDPKCKELIRDLEEVSWAVDSTGAPTKELNKSDKNRTHASDALGYFISRVFSMKGKMGEKDDGRIIF